MNLKSRIKKLEQSAGLDKDLCKCPDALALAATPYFNTCYKCGKTIDVKTWKHWQMIEPTLETNCFAFGLRRDDNEELEGKTNDYFQMELRQVFKI